MPGSVTGRPRRRLFPRARRDWRKWLGPTRRRLVEKVAPWQGQLRSSGNNRSARATARRSSPTAASNVHTKAKGAEPKSPRFDAKDGKPLVGEVVRADPYKGIVRRWPRATPTVAANGSTLRASPGG